MSGYTEIDMHLDEFEGLALVNYDPAAGLSDPATTCPRLYTQYVDYTTEPVPLSATRKVAMIAVVLLTAVGMVLWSAWAVLFGVVAIGTLLPGAATRHMVSDLPGMWAKFGAESQLEELRALVIGPWFDEIDQGPEVTIQRLVELAPRLPNLRAIFFGDIVCEECEISWIEQGNLTPLLDAYPDLEVLYVRGSNNLRFESLEHSKLRKLVVQSGVLGRETIADLTSARLPALEHLEVWFGSPIYGFDATIEDLRPLWKPSRYEALRSLALRNCSLSDEIANELARDQAAVSRLDRLDLSLGTLTDLGAEALYNNPAILHLDSLDLHYHYLSDDWIERLQTLPIDVDVTDPQGYVNPEDSDDPRYVAVGE